MAQCDNSKDVDVATAEIDLTVIDKVRGNMPCLEHRRNDIYSLVPVDMKGIRFTEAFLFQTYPIHVDTIFYETEHSVAFTNVRCVVNGRILLMLLYS